MSLDNSMANEILDGIQRFGKKTILSCGNTYLHLQENDWRKRDKVSLEISYKDIVELSYVRPYYNKTFLKKIAIFLLGGDRRERLKNHILIKYKVNEDFAEGGYNVELTEDEFSLIKKITGVKNGGYSAACN